MKLTVACVALLFVSTSAMAWGDRCAFTAQREVALDVPSASALAVIAAAGDLTIRGEPGLTRVTATAKACASTQELLDATVLASSNEAGIATLRAVTPEASGSFWNDAYAYLDVQVRVPAAAELRVHDSSGDTKVENVAALEVDDSSGDLSIRAVRGQVRITDSSGDVKVRDVGSVLVSNDSSGDMEFTNVAGIVHVMDDSSGDIGFDEVDGDAIVDVDSSGEINFTRVHGNAIVDSDSSGSISAMTIGGDFVVHNDGSGDITHRDVKGRVDVPDSED